MATNILEDVECNVASLKFARKIFSASIDFIEGQGLSDASFLKSKSAFYVNIQIF